MKKILCTILAVLLLSAGALAEGFVAAKTMDDIVMRYEGMTITLSHPGEIALYADAPFNHYDPYGAQITHDMMSGSGRTFFELWSGDPANFIAFQVDGFKTSQDSLKVPYTIGEVQTGVFNGMTVEYVNCRAEGVNNLNSVYVNDYCYAGVQAMDGITFCIGVEYTYTQERGSRMGENFLENLFSHITIA